MSEYADLFDYQQSTLVFEVVSLGFMAAMPC